MEHYNETITTFINFLVVTESKVINQHHDNEEEQFPIVDEQGNILGAISADMLMMDAKYCTLWCICMY